MSYVLIFLNLGNEYSPPLFLQLNKHSVLVVLLAVLGLQPNPPQHRVAHPWGIPFVFFRCLSEHESTLLHWFSYMF